MSEVELNDRFAPTESERRERRQKLAQTLAKGGMDGVHIISYETAREVLTPRRIELMRAIREEEPESVRELARLVDRDPGRISRELETLASHGIVTFEQEGRNKRPILTHDHIVPEPVF